MNGRFLVRLLVVGVLIAALIGAGAFIYNMGVMRGAAGEVPLGGGPGQFEGRDGRFLAYPHFGFGFMPFFGCFGLIIPLLLLFLLFGAMRWAFWGGRWGAMRGPGHWGEHGAPPMFEEWHRRAHGEEPTEKSEKPEKPEEPTKSK